MARRSPSRSSRSRSGTSRRTSGSRAPRRDYRSNRSRVRTSRSRSGGAHTLRVVLQTSAGTPAVALSDAGRLMDPKGTSGRSKY